MQWGGEVEFLEDVEEILGRPTQALESRPELPADLQLFLDAFHDLSGDRQIGFGAVGSITFTAIDRYAERHGIEGDDFERLKLLIKELDGVFLDHVQKRAPAHKDKGTN